MTCPCVIALLLCFDIGLVGLVDDNNFYEWEIMIIG